MENPGDSAGSAAPAGGWRRAIRSPERVRDALLSLMALTSGYIDAVSFLGLGHVFTSVMTGNTIILGIALSRADWLDVGLTLTALASYLAGVATGTLILEGGERQGIWPASVTIACVVELGALLAFGIGGVLAGSPGEGDILYVLVALGAFAMGIQSASARALNVTRITTTYFTGTWTAFMEGITRRLRALAGGRDLAASERKLPSRRVLARQGAVLCSYVLAAVAGGASVIHWQLRAAVAPAIPVALIIGVAWFRFHRAPTATFRSQS